MRRMLIGIALAITTLSATAGPPPFQGDPVWITNTPLSVAPKEVTIPFDKAGSLRCGQIRMEETVELDLGPATETTQSEAAQAEAIASTPIVAPEAEKTQRAPRKKKTTE